MLPPEMAGTIAISAPSLAGVLRFSKNRTSSPSTYTLMKRRRLPESSQTLLRMPGNLLSSLSITSFTVPASTSTTSAPPVCLRSGAGITPLSAMGDSFDDTFECLDLRVDHFRRRQRYRIRCLEAVAGDRHNG